MEDITLPEAAKICVKLLMHNPVKHFIKKHMNYFSVSFLAVIDGIETDEGLVGVTSIKNDHHPNRVTNAATAYIRKKYPNAKNVAIRIMKIDELDVTTYDSISSQFIDFVN